MDYFILELDEHYIPPKPINYKGRLNDSIIRLQKPNQMPKRMVFYIERHMQTVETDIILYPCFLVSKKIYKVIQLYDSSIRFVKILFYDPFKRKSKNYYIPFLREIDCLMDKSKLSPDKSIIYEAYIDGNKIKDKPVLRIAGVNSKCIIIRLDLVESILRRDAIGIGLKEINVIYDETK